MICASCHGGLDCEQKARNSDGLTRDHWRRLVINAHWGCRGNCDCLHEGFLEIAGKPAKPLYHGGVGGLPVGAVLRPPTESGFLRPQVCMEEVNLKEANQDWLTFKRTYRADRIYATTAIHLARDHAAGFTIWSKVTGADQKFGSYGAVYRVEPVHALAPDLGIADEHCCMRVHELTDWCAFSAQQFLIMEVVEPAVEAKVNGLAARRLTKAYDLWREKNGGVDWWQNQ